VANDCGQPRDECTRVTRHRGDFRRRRRDEYVADFTYTLRNIDTPDDHGLPPRRRMFFPGRRLEPPRAAMSARILTSQEIAATLSSPRPRFFPGEIGIRARCPCRRQRNRILT